jgi:excisionase family DNA binding protein
LVKRPGNQRPHRTGMDKLLLTPCEAAIALGISRSKLYELLAKGDIGSVHIGASRRIPTEALAAYVRSLREQTAISGSRSHSSDALPCGVPGDCSRRPGS